VKVSPSQFAQISPTAQPINPHKNPSTQIERNETLFSLFFEIKCAPSHQISRQLPQANIFSITQYEKNVKDLVESDSIKTEGTKKTTIKIGRKVRSIAQLSNLSPRFFPTIPVKNFVVSN